MNFQKKMQKVLFFHDFLRIRTKHSVRKPENIGIFFHFSLEYLPLKCYIARIFICNKIL